MKTTHAWTLVAKRELSVRLRDKTFIGSTLLSLVILVAVFGFQAWNANKATTYDLAVTSQSQEMGQAIVDAAPGIDDKVSVQLIDVDDAGTTQTTTVADPQRRSSLTLVKVEAVGGAGVAHGLVDAVLDGVAVQIQLLGGMEMTLLGGQEH